MPKPVSIRARRCGSLSRLKRENGTRNKTATTGARYCNTSPSMRKWAAGVTTRTCGMSTLRVIVTAEERKRNAEQNRYYWSAVLQHIAEHAEVGGRRYDKDVWHEYFAR